MSEVKSYKLTPEEITEKFKDVKPIKRDIRFTNLEKNFRTWWEQAILDKQERGDLESEHRSDVQQQK